MSRPPKKHNCPICGRFLKRATDGTWYCQMPHKEERTLYVLESLSSSEAGVDCPDCGPTLWVVDGDRGTDKVWLLCTNSSCVQTVPIPQNMKVES